MRAVHEVDAIRGQRRGRTYAESFSFGSANYGAHRRGELVSMRGEKGVGLGFGCSDRLSAGCLGPGAG